MNVSIIEENVFEQTDRPFEKVYHREPSTAGRLKCQDESLHWLVVQVKFAFQLLLIKARGVENKCGDSFAAKNIYYSLSIIFSKWKFELTNVFNSC